MKDIDQIMSDFEDDHDNDSKKYKLLLDFVLSISEYTQTPLDVSKFEIKYKKPLRVNKWIKGNDRSLF